MKKSLLIYFNSLKPAGGIERVIVTLANKLSSDLDITILVKDQPFSFYKLDSNIKIVSLNLDFFMNMSSIFYRFFSVFRSLLLSSFKVRVFLNDNSFDFVYLAHPLNVLEYHLAKKVNKSIILSEHGAPDAYNIFYKFIKRILYPNAKYYLIPNKTDFNFYKKFNFPVYYLPHFKSELNFNKVSLESNVALSIGRFTDVKQQIVLLNVWNRLVNFYNFKDWKLYLVGTGELKLEFEEFIFNNNLIDHVILCPTRIDVEFYYNQASLFLLSSKSEGFGMVLLEAISFGLPCISFDCPSGPRDFIVNRFNGFLIPNNDFLEFEKSVLNLINNPQLIKEYGNNSFIFSEQMSDRVLIDKWNDVFS